MIPRLLTLLYAVRSSLWALPLAMVVGAVALAYLTLHVTIDVQGGVWYLFSGSGRQAPQFLSSLMSAMITMATLAISITMVVLALAAQQLGPRLIQSVMADRRTQISLGIQVGTVTYLILVLRSVYVERDSVPNLAVTGGTVLVLVSVISLVIFVHHLARSIVADTIIENVGRQLDANIRRLLPPESDPAAAHEPPSDRGPPVTAANGGYVQVIDYDAISAAASNANATVTLLLRAGQHTISGAIVARVDRDGPIDDDLENAIRNAIIVGRERTTVQDIEFSIRQLVEIALRALSPGINDVYTAMTVVDRLSQSLAEIMKRGAAQTRWRDVDGKTRVIAPASTFDGIVAVSYNQIRQSALGNPSMLIRLAESLAQLIKLADADQRAPLETQMKLVLAAGRRSIGDRHDLEDLEDRAREIGVVATLD